MSASRVPWRLIGGLLLVGGLLAADRPRRRRRAFPDDAPPPARMGRIARRHAAASVLVNAPRAALYDFWREPANLLRFVPGLHGLEKQDDGSFIATLAGTEGDRRLHLRVAETVHGERIVWEGVTGDLLDRAQLSLRDAPGGRGAILSLETRRPAQGLLGLFGPGDAAETLRLLRRFRMLTEAGEIATSANRRPAAGPEPAPEPAPEIREEA